MGYELILAAFLCYLQATRLTATILTLPSYLDCFFICQCAMARTSSTIYNESCSVLSSAQTFEIGGSNNYRLVGAPRLDVSLSDSQSLLSPETRPTYYQTR